MDSHPSFPISSSFHLLSSPLLLQFEAAVKRLAKNILYPVVEAGQPRPDVPDCQVTLRSGSNLISLRDLHADSIAHLARVPGIVIGCSNLSSRATSLHIMCRDCRHTKMLPIKEGGFSGYNLPRYCDGPTPEGQSKQCSTDPFLVIHEKCRFVDSQNLKLQEAPDMVPVGELPRHMQLTVDRSLCSRVVPGSRIIATGIYSTFNNSRNAGKSSIALRQPYLRVVGLEIDSEGAGGRGSQRLFSAKEEDEFSRMARTPDLFEKFSKSIAPSIFGNQGEFGSWGMLRK